MKRYSVLMLLAVAIMAITLSGCGASNVVLTMGDSSRVVAQALVADGYLKVGLGNIHVHDSNDKPVLLSASNVTVDLMGLMSGETVQICDAKLDPGTYKDLSVTFKSFDSQFSVKDDKDTTDPSDDVFVWGPYSTEFELNNGNGIEVVVPGTIVVAQDGKTTISWNFSASMLVTCNQNTASFANSGSITVKY